MDDDRRRDEASRSASSSCSILLTHVIQARRAKAGTEGTRADWPRHSVIVLGAFDSRGQQNGDRRCEERSSSSEVVACRSKLAFRHGPAVPCCDLRRITACSAAFASGPRGSGPRREATVPMLPRVLQLVSHPSHVLYALQNHNPAVQLISRCVSLTALQICRYGLVRNSAEMTFDSTAKASLRQHA
jgi:hypothetical protein